MKPYRVDGQWKSVHALTGDGPLYMNLLRARRSSASLSAVFGERPTFEWTDWTDYSHHYQPNAVFLFWRDLIERPPRLGNGNSLLDYWIEDPDESIQLLGAAYLACPERTFRAVSRRVADAAASHLSETSRPSEEDEPLRRIVARMYASFLDRGTVDPDLLRSGLALTSAPTPSLPALKGSEERQIFWQTVDGRAREDRFMFDLLTGFVERSPQARVLDLFERLGRRDHEDWIDARWLALIRRGAELHRRLPLRTSSGWEEAEWKVACGRYADETGIPDPRLDDSAG